MFAVDSAGLREGQERLAKDSDHRAGDFETDNTGGLLSGLLAEEEGRAVLSAVQAGLDWGRYRQQAPPESPTIGGGRELLGAYRTRFVAPAQRVTKSNLQRSSAITFANDSACGACAMM